MIQVELNFPDLPDAACNGMTADLFFPTTGEHAEEAAALCRLCPERTACLDWALEHNELHGIWGGLNRPERERLRRRDTRPRKVRVCIDCPSTIVGAARRCERCKPVWDEAVQEGRREANRAYRLRVKESPREIHP